jgi:hypothetical protein
VSARAVNTAEGTLSGLSNVNTFTIDVTPPLAPVVNTPADGSRTADTTPTYTGTAEAGSTVTIYVDGVAVGTTTAAADGTWGFEQPTALADGPHMVKATATDRAGNVSPDSNTNTFTVDTTPPAAPVVLNPPDGSSTNNTRPTYTGTAEAGSTVTVFVDGVVAGTTTADAAGNWSFTQPTALPEGPHMVKARAADALGNVSADSNTNTFTVDTTPPAAPVVNMPANGSSITDTTPTYTGTAEAGSTVTVYVDGAVVGTTTADGAGSWSFTQPTSLAEGPHTVKATATDRAGNVSPDSNTNTFSVDATLPEAPVVTSPANNSVTNDNTPTITGTAPPNVTVTVTLEGNVLGTTTSDASGNWSLTPTTPLPDATYAIVATTTDSRGNTSLPSTPVRFTVDTTAPDTEIVSGPSEQTSKRTATFDFGSSEAGVTYECRLDGGTFAPCEDPSTYADLALGEHTLEVRARDAMGNVDATPASFTWNISSSDRAFLGDGMGCAAAGGDRSALAMMGLALLGLVLARGRRR